jgi:hypothetical protein
MAKVSESEAKRDKQSEIAAKALSLKRSKIAEDRLRGVEAISEYTGFTRRQAEYRLMKGLIPHWREGVLYVASKKAIDEQHAQRATYRPAASEAA